MMRENENLSYRDLFRYLLSCLSVVDFVKETIIMSLVLVNLMIIIGIIDGQFQNIAQIRIFMDNPFFIIGVIFSGVLYNFIYTLLNQVVNNKYGLKSWNVVSTGMCSNKQKL